MRARTGGAAWPAPALPVASWSGAGVLARQDPFEEVSGLKREARPDRVDYLRMSGASPASHEAA